FLREDYSLLGFEITEPFFIEQTTGSLNKAIAELMLEIADVKKITNNNENKTLKEKNEKILDPMCGTGIIPLLCFIYGYEAYGNDIDKEKINIAEKNKTYLKEREKNKIKKIEFTNNDALKLKFQDNYFSKIICNLPFGKEIQFKNDNKEILTDEEKKDFYYKFFKEMIRISKKDAVFVFLTMDLEKIKEISSDLNLEIKDILKIVNSGLVLYLLKIQKYL
ncbi:MAG: methyltransferase domain-containing protein, partial [Candidatus Woesearchaeota archaeon]